MTAGVQTHKPFRLGYTKRNRLAGRLYDSFRNQLMWFPEFPSPKMHLNEASFLGKMNNRMAFQPMCCALFGGPGGEYLRSLRGLSVTFHGWSRPRILDIEFRYLNSNRGIPSTCQKIPHYNRHDQQNTPTSEFWNINGSGGECIKDVEVNITRHGLEGLKVMSFHLLLFSFPLSLFPKIAPCRIISNIMILQITTNKGTFHTFGKRSAYDERQAPKYTKIDITPGTIPIGLYTRRVQDQVMLTS